MVKMKICCIALCFLLFINLAYCEDEIKIVSTRKKRMSAKVTITICNPWTPNRSTKQDCEKLGCEYFPNFGDPSCGKRNKVQPSGGCFPGNAMVTTPTGNVAMETLNIGDQVLTVLENMELGFTNVLNFAERKVDKEAHFLSITTVNQAGHTHTVKLTATHNIYVKTDDHDYIPKFAEDVLIGDVLKTQADSRTAVNEVTVTQVTLHKEMGVYNPLTETGTMLVDGTLVSCYGSFNHYLAHLAMAPIRWLPWLFVDAEKPLDGTLPYVETAKYVAHNYIAPIVSIN